MSQIDILHLDWPNSERDLNISIPVLVYLKKKYNYKVISKNIFNGLYYLKIHKPKVLLLSNAIGAEINYIVSKYAYLSGIKVITLTSEGNFKKEHMSTFFWGWNKDKKIYHHLQNIWSERALKLTIEHIPEFKKIGFVGGGTGFDKYQLLPQLTKVDFHNKYPSLKQYNSIIGITSYGYFEHLNTPEYFKKHKIDERYSADQIQMYYNDFESLTNSYYELIKSNPDTLFILRTHPISKNLDKTEFTRCANLPNVFLSIPSNQELSTLNNSMTIAECISISDIWVAYESTTILEAWLLNKPTIVFNPTTFEFDREANYKGAMKISCLNELTNSLKNYIQFGTLKEFDELKPERERIINETIGFSDGKNHERVANRIHQFISNIGNDKPNTKNIPNSVMWKHTKNYLKQKSKLYQMYNPYVHNVYKQNDKKNFQSIYLKYDNAINP